MSGRPRKGPDKEHLKKYLAKGMTQAEIADKWENETGMRVQRSTISMAMKRYGLEAAHVRPRHSDVLPWHVRTEHLMHYDARMLRLEGRRRKGQPVSPENLELLQAWRDRLDGAGAVVTYNPDTAEGFFWTHRKPGDTDIIRAPKQVKPKRRPKAL